MTGNLAPRLFRVAHPFWSRTISTSTDAGWSSLVARRAHNPKVAGSNPAPATNEDPCTARVFSSSGIPLLGRY